ncbi:hypothetical protein ON010_g1403 [Phytophthora cinnamomi]|nr:hypothetical protein ON010_g1403 [Phytophthora cinnamomi]
MTQHQQVPHSKQEAHAPQLVLEIVSFPQERDPAQNHQHTIITQPRRIKPSSAKGNEHVVVQVPVVHMNEARRDDPLPVPIAQHSVRAAAQQTSKQSTVNKNDNSFSHFTTTSATYSEYGAKSSGVWCFWK